MKTSPSAITKQTPQPPAASERLLGTARMQLRRASLAYEAAAVGAFPAIAIPAISIVAITARTTRRQRYNRRPCRRSGPRAGGLSLSISRLPELILMLIYVF